MTAGSDLTLDTTNVRPGLKRRSTLEPWVSDHTRNNEVPFTLDDEFLIQFVNKVIKWGPIGYFIYKRTYARELDCISDRHLSLAKSAGLTVSEEWWLTVCRVVEGTNQIIQQHCLSLNIPWSAEKAQQSAQEMYNLIFDFKFLPPGRGLWMMGTDYVKKAGGAALNNCAFVSTNEIHTSFSSPFCFLMDMSMLGVGVGGDCRGAGTVLIQEPELDDEVHVVADSREGWVELIRRCLDAFVGKATWPSNIDVSNVRPEGALIRGFGGRASGPAPLLELAAGIFAILKPRIHKSITSADIVDLFNLIGRCVVSGNVRRSAEIMFGDIDDNEFAELKSPDAHPEFVNPDTGHWEHPWRWASNNPIFAEVGMDYTDVARRTIENGEPGYMWLENARNYGRMGHNPDYEDTGVMGGNPCLEQSLESFELCCLVETFPSLVDSYPEYERVLKFAYLYAKAVTLVPTHEARTNAVMLRNRRIGCSQSGIVANMYKVGVRTHLNWCDDGYQHIQQRDEQYSKWLCVPRSKKTTSVKPSGTVSNLPGVPPGIHHPEAEYYYRVVRVAPSSPLWAKYEAAGYRCVDLRPNRPEIAIYFAVKEPHFKRGKADVTMWEQLEIAGQMQRDWADNQVSVTITYQPHEAKDIPYALALYETRLKGVSFLPLDCRHYAHAPFQPITNKEYEVYISNITDVDISNTRNEIVDKFCDGDVCLVPEPLSHEISPKNGNGKAHS